MPLEDEIKRARAKTWDLSYVSGISVWGRRIPQVYLEKFVSLCKTRKVARIIDVGCGSGLYTAYFSLQGFHMIAMDISRNGLILAKHLVNSLNFLKRTKTINVKVGDVDFLRGELPHLPFVDGEAEAIFVNFTLHQLTHIELSVCLAQFKRILELGGVLLVHEPCGDVLQTPSEPVEVLEDGSLFLKKHKLVNWNITRDQVSKIMDDNFNIIDEERLEERGMSKIMLVLESI